MSVSTSSLSVSSRPRIPMGSGSPTNTRQPMSTTHSHFSSRKVSLQSANSRETCCTLYVLGSNPNVCSLAVGILLANHYVTPLPAHLKISRTVGGVQDVDVVVDVGVVGAGHLHRGGGGKDQDVRAGRVLWRAELGRLDVERGAAAEHGARRHRV